MISDFLILDAVSSKTDRAPGNGGPWRTIIEYREPNAASKKGRRIKYVTCYGTSKKQSISSAFIQLNLRLEAAKQKRLNQEG